MSRARLIAVLAGALAATGTPSFAEDAPAAHPAGAPSWAFFETYCNECHNATDWAGGVAFDTLDTQIAPNAEVMEKVVRKMRGQLMPPGGHKLPAPAEARASKYTPASPSAASVATTKHANATRSTVMPECARGGSLTSGSRSSESRARARRAR